MAKKTTFTEEEKQPKSYATDPVNNPEVYLARLRNSINALELTIVSYEKANPTIWKIDV